MMSKSKIVVILFFFIPSAIIYSQTIGQATVKTWAGDKQSAFSLTFDDGYQSQIDNARPVLDSYGFKGTFYVIAGSLVDLGQKQIFRYGNWDEFTQMANEGHEIAAHTMTHPDLTQIPVGDINTPGTLNYELYQSQVLIEQKTGKKVLTLAYPFTYHNAEVDNTAAQYFESSRAGGNTTNNPNITGLTWQQLGSYEIRFDTPRNSFADDQDELTQVKNWTQNMINNNQWGVVFTHEVIPQSEITQAVNAGYWYPMSVEWLNSFCQWLKSKSDSNKVWVETVANITKYIKERENFSSYIVSSSPSSLELQVTDNLADSIFNYPLTVDVQVPAGWTTVNFSQGILNQTVSAFSAGNNRYVRVNIIPDGGNVVLVNAGANLFALSGQVTYGNALSTPLKNVTIKIKDSNNIEQTTVTDNAGNYSFVNLAAGDYTININKTDGWGGVNSADALLAVKYFTNSVSLSPLQIAGADVDNNQIINAADALLILKRYANLISAFNIPDWIFSSQGSVITIADQNIIKNIQGIAAGNVTGSYIP